MNFYPLANYKQHQQPESTQLLSQVSTFQAFVHQSPAQNPTIHFHKWVMIVKSFLREAKFISRSALYSLSSFTLASITLLLLIFQHKDL
jgi:hypothetical protein